jgi:pilus assembly protein CpaC
MSVLSPFARRRGGSVALRVLFAITALGLCGLDAAAEDRPKPAQGLLVSTHTQLKFEKDYQRVAVADPEILSFEPLNEREVLVLGRSRGRTTLMVWFADGTTESFLFHVQRDLSLLEEALAEIHPSITVHSAPDRDAVVLRGVVPDISYSNAAEEMAQRYLDARKSRKGRTSPGVKVGRPGEAPSADAPAAPAAPMVESIPDVEPTAAVINLIRVQQLPGRLEDRMIEAFRSLGSGQIEVRRLVRGRSPDDEIDIFVLTGSVDTQVSLVRAISVAQSLLGVEGEDEIKVRADESGALRDELTGGAQGQMTGSSNLNQLLGGGTSTSLENLIEANIGRAKVVEAANGRLISFLEVTDIPQVRVDIRLYEVNCTKLRSFNSDWGAIGTNFSQTGLLPSVPGQTLQGFGAPSVGTQGKNPDIQNVLGFLAGTLTNQFQLSGDNFTFDWLLSFLETKGYARSLSRPQLTVLSGERALFQVGGEIPVPTSVATATQQVFSGVDFKAFGVQLNVRPLVGENGDVVIDLAPQISLPDAQLTASVRESTGQTQETSAFRTRYLQTTAKLKDGQALLVGGLMSRNVTGSDSSTPGISDLPLIGGAFAGYERQGDEFQLVVLVHPVVVRTPSDRVRAWAFPTVQELMSAGCSRR